MAEVVLFVRKPSDVLESTCNTVHNVMEDLTIHILRPNKERKLERSSNNSFVTSCPICHKNFRRLDVHLRWNPQCRDPVSADKSSPVRKLQQNQHSELLADVTQTIDKTHPSIIPTSESPSHQNISFPTQQQPHTPSPSPPTCIQSPTYPTPAHHTVDSTIPSKAPLRVPQTSDAEAWSLCEDFIQSFLLPHVMRERQIEEKVKVFSDGLYTFLGSNFGYIHRVRKATKRVRGHERKLKQLRADKNTVRRKFREAVRNCEPKSIISSLASEYHKLVRMHSKLRQASICETTIKSIEKERSRCARDIWKFSNDLLDENKNTSVDPTFTRETCDSFFHATYSNNSDIPIEVAPWMTPRQLPTTPFNLLEFSLEEIQNRLKTCRNGSAPGPIDQIPYQIPILKRCPSCSLILLHIFNCCLSSSFFPHMWQTAVIKLISKPSAKSDSDNPSNFRPIALTSCIGKVFTTLLKDRLLDYAVHNAYCGYFHPKRVCGWHSWMPREPPQVVRDD